MAEATIFSAGHIYRNSALSYLILDVYFTATWPLLQQRVANLMISVIAPLLHLTQTTRCVICLNGGDICVCAASDEDLEIYLRVKCKTVTAITHNLSAKLAWNNATVFKGLRGAAVISGGDNKKPSSSVTEEEGIFPRAYGDMGIRGPHFPTRLVLYTFF